MKNENTRKIYKLPRDKVSMRTTHRCYLGVDLSDKEYRNNYFPYASSLNDGQCADSGG